MDFTQISRRPVAKDRPQWLAQGVVSLPMAPPPHPRPVKPLVRPCGKPVPAWGGAGGCEPHLFRRSLATAAVRRAVSLHVIQRVTGHKSLGSLGHYLEADESEVLAAIVG